MKTPIAIGAFVLLTACNQTPPTNFFTLASRPQAETTQDQSELADDARILALAPISLPAYLERPQFVLRLDATRMQIADFDSWIEPLDTLIQRTLATNLQSAPDIRLVVQLPQRRPVDFDLGIEISIKRFEATAQGLVWIDADWVVVDANENEIARETFTRHLPVTDPGGYPERSMALSGLLDELSTTVLDGLEDKR